MPRISSLDPGYQPGDLSLYPQAYDDKESLYEVRNNAETKLKQSLSYNGKNVLVDDTSTFPPTGLIRLGPPAGVPGSAELIYYGSKTAGKFGDLIRGFAGSRQNQWPQNTDVTNAVMAETHNSIKDAIINIQSTVGTKNNPDPNSLNGILKQLETRFLAPKPAFRAYPLVGAPALTVRFQNFSEGDAIRWLWDFGDGSSSVERSPNHTYQAEGIYSVKLNIITSSGAQGIAVKSNYITVSEEKTNPFFYVELDNDALPAYSVETATNLSATPATWLYVDQSDGNITQRIWVFGDGTNETVSDPDIHTTTHIYNKPGEYNPSLFILFANQKIQRVFLSSSITVI
jgi:PKD repeat protein